MCKTCPDAIDVCTSCDVSADPVLFLMDDICVIQATCEMTRFWNTVGSVCEGKLMYLHYIVRYSSEVLM